MNEHAQALEAIRRLAPDAPFEVAAATYRRALLTHATGRKLASGLAYLDQFGGASNA